MYDKTQLMRGSLEEMCIRDREFTPVMMDYAPLADKDSMYNLSLIHIFFSI